MHQPRQSAASIVRPSWPARRWPALLLRAALLAGGLATLVWLLAATVGAGINDFTLVFRPVALAWLAGETRLFDAASRGFFNPPWAVWAIAPLALLPPAWGQAVVNALGLVGIVLSLHLFGQGLRPWLKVLAATPFCLFMLIMAGNLDGLLLLGFGLSWLALVERRPWLLGAGLWLATLKPINALPLLLVVAVFTWRWSWSDKLKAGIPLLASLLLSFVVFGFDWPLRYLRIYAASPPFDFPIVTLWKTGAQLGLPLVAVAALALAVVAVSLLAFRGLGLIPAAMALVTSGWMLVTPYALDIHYVLLVPAFLVAARRSPALALLAYLATFLPLLRIPFGFGIIGIDMLYPLLLWLGALAISRTAASNAGVPAPLAA